MLTELIVTNLGVIERAELLLDSGLIALSGETGAGKTLITEAINLLLGQRGDSALVRHGQNEATVEGRFLITNPELFKVASAQPVSSQPQHENELQELVVRRVLSAKGRGRCYMNGEMATIAQLQEAVRPLVQIHGQHSQQGLLRPKVRRDTLDAYGRHDLQPLQEAESALQQVLDQLLELGGDEQERAREIDLLTHQVTEIEQAAIQNPNESEELFVQEKTLGDAHSHIVAGEKAHQLLDADGAIADALTAAISEVQDRVPFSEPTTRLLGMQAELQDLSSQVRDITDSIEDDPAALHEIQMRRKTLSDLCRKYGPDLAAVIEYGQKARKRLDMLTSYEQRFEQLQTQKLKLQAKVDQCCEDLASERHTTAAKLSKQVMKHLKDLAMPAAQIAVTVQGRAGQDVDIQAALNAGSQLLPITKVASGGELSRIMLAMQLVVGSPTSTVIFDEIDAGVGGAAATTIGRALADLAKEHQVLVVTHLAQVAAFADTQVKIEKTSDESSTRTELSNLKQDERIVELARMMSGAPDSDSARLHAKELLLASSRKP